MVLDGVRGVDDQVEEDLVDVAAVAHHRRQVAEVGVDVGDVLVLVRGHDQRVAQGAVEVERPLLCRRRVRELAHRAHDRGDAAEPVGGALEGRRDALAQVVEVGVVLGRADALEQLGGHGPATAAASTAA